MLPMIAAHIELVKSTIPVLREHGVALTSYFYQRMLKNHPELKNTFNLDHQSSGMQPRALAGAVLAYAENIENPAVLAKAVERITTKHVSLNIQPEQYVIVGENLLHSISEVLDVPMESELIAAWKAAYTQLAELLIAVEQAKYATLATQQGAWTGWRNFQIQAISTQDDHKVITLAAQDQEAIMPANTGDYISVRVHVPEQDLLQPQQFVFNQAQQDSYQIVVPMHTQASEFTVHHILVNHYQIGDVLEVSAPQSV